MRLTSIGSLATISLAYVNPYKRNKQFRETGKLRAARFRKQRASPSPLQRGSLRAGGDWRAPAAAAAGRRRVRRTALPGSRRRCRSWRAGSSWRGRARPRSGGWGPCGPSETVKGKKLLINWNSERDTFGSYKVQRTFVLLCLGTMLSNSMRIFL